MRSLLLHADSASGAPTAMPHRLPKQPIAFPLPTISLILLKITYLEVQLPEAVDATTKKKCFRRDSSTPRNETFSLEPSSPHKIATSCRNFLWRKVSIRSLLWRHNVSTRDIVCHYPTTVVLKPLKSISVGNPRCCRRVRHLVLSNAVAATVSMAAPSSVTAGVAQVIVDSFDVSSSQPKHDVSFP